MKATVGPYTPVYPFCDDLLLEAFLGNIPRSTLIELARKDEGLRNRNFAGFRLTRQFPTDRQLHTAYKREVIDRKNALLAHSLSDRWIAQQPALTGVALKALGIEADGAMSASAWIEHVRAAIGTVFDVDAYTKLVQVLARDFPHEDVHIFTSIISSGHDQSKLRNTIEQALATTREVIPRSSEEIAADISLASASIQALELQVLAVRSDLEKEATKVAEALASLQNKHDLLHHGLTQQNESIDALVNDLERKQRQLAVLRQSRDEAKLEIQQVVRSIDLERSNHTSDQTGLNNRLVMLLEFLGNKTGELVKLRNELTVEVERAESEQRLLAASQVLSRDTEVSVDDANTAPAITATPLTAALVAERLPAGIDTNTICYQVLQRTFRNSVVLFLRERMTRLFPDDHVARIRKLFGDEWDKAAQNAARSRQSLGTTTTIRDEYDLLGTNHFFSVFDRFYDKLFTLEAGQQQAIPKPVKPRLLGNLKAIKDARDPLSHPVEEQIPFDEAQHILYIVQEVLKWLGFTSQAAEVAVLTSQLVGLHQADTPHLLRRLPSEDSIYMGWVGRDKLLRELTDCFANPFGKRCLLAGDGGKGKSAAAYRFVQGMSSASSRYQLIIWLSAKKRRFSEGLPTNIETPDFVTANEAIDRLLIEYGATSEDMKLPLLEKKHLLFEYLNEFPAFIVADDIDTVLDDDEVVSLFTYEIPHTKSSVLVTSRRAIPGIRSFVVPGFDLVEAEEFAKSRIQLYGLNPQDFTSAVIKDIARATDGLPLYMDDLMRLTKIVDIRKAIAIWNEKGGDEARKYALQREVEKLSASARNCLIAAAVLDDPISFAELENILSVSEDRIVSALTELQTLFLFPKAPTVEGEQRYQINLNTKKLIRLVEGNTDAYARIENKAKALAGVLPDAGRGVVGSLIRQALLRFNAGQVSEAEAILTAAIEKYPNAPDLQGVLGFIYRQEGRISDARLQFEAAYKLKTKNLKTYLHWQKMEIAAKEWSKALSVADRALKLIPEAYEITERKVFTLRQAGFDMHRGLHYEKATKMWSDAVDEVERNIKHPESLPTGARALNASLFSSIVVCLDMLRRSTERDRWLERWEKEHPDDPQVAGQKDFIARKRRA